MQFAEKIFAQILMIGLPQIPRIYADKSPADFADLHRFGLNILAPTRESLFQNALSVSFTVFCGARMGALRAILSYLKDRKE